MSELEPFLTPLISSGISGIILAYFMWNANKKDDRQHEFKKEWLAAMIEGNKIAQKFTDAVTHNTTVLDRVVEHLEKQS